MNININYDLIEKIQEAKGKYNLKRNLKNGFKYTIPYTTGSIIGCIIAHLLDKNKGITDLIISNAIGYAFIVPIPFLASKISNITSPKSKKDYAYSKLNVLCGNLKYYNIKTNVPLLLNSILYNKKYKLELNKKSLPKLIEEKQIIIPTEDNNSNVKEIMILQQHNVASNQYVLSLNKKRK